MAKGKSRPARWADAAASAQTALSDINASIDEFDSAIADLRSIQEEYEEWKDNLPESLQSSPVGEKLEAIADMEIEDAGSSIRDAVELLGKVFSNLQETFEDLRQAASELEDKTSEIEEAELPRGFGKD